MNNYSISISTLITWRARMEDYDLHQGWAPRPAPPRPAKKGLPRPAPPRNKANLAPPRENWQNLRGGAGQSLFESLEN